jgi:hypothetical protein
MDRSILEEEGRRTTSALSTNPNNIAETDVVTVV